MTRPQRQKKGDRLTYSGASPEEIRCDYAVGPLDTVATEMDSVWGVDVLPTLVSPATAERYGSAIAHLNASIDASDPAATAAAAQNCIRGLHAMDAEARAAGRIPSPPACWLTEIDGKRYGFVQDVAFAVRAKAAYPDAVIFTLREAVVALRPMSFGLVAEVKQLFPGAEVTAIRPRTNIEQDLDDEIIW